MDKDIQKGLSDRVYDKRKGAAVEVEQVIKDCLEDGNRSKIDTIIQQLSTDFAYAIHNPNARNGGLIGLAAAAIALGQHEVSHYLDDIVHPVLACFGDQDSRVRYYACESMYNIGKVAKGEILPYFNELFDALCKLSADSDETVQKGADLLNRLIKDIVSEKAATYVSVVVSGPPEVIPPQVEGNPDQPVLANEPPQADKRDHNDVQDDSHRKVAFSLPKFIPLLMERIYVINPAARTFLVSWITLLDSIPDLELVSYLPEFLGGLINFLNDPANGVRVASHAALDNFLQEIRRITEVKKDLEQRQARIALQHQARQRSIEAAQAVAAQRKADAEKAAQEAAKEPEDSQKEPTVAPSSEGQVESKGDSVTDPTPESTPKDKAIDSLSKTLSDVSLSSGFVKSAVASPRVDKYQFNAPAETTNSESSKDLNEPLTLAGADGIAASTLDNQSDVKDLVDQHNTQTEIDDENRGPANTENELVIDEDSAPLTPVDPDEVAIDDEEYADEDEDEDEGYYVPGQDVHIDFEKIIEILISHLDSSVEEIQIVVLKWIEAFLDMSPGSILPYGPRFLSVLLPTMAHETDDLRKAAERVNQKLLGLIMTLPDTYPTDGDTSRAASPGPSNNNAIEAGSGSGGRNTPTFLIDTSAPALSHPLGIIDPTDRDKRLNGLDYSAMVNALTLHFLDEKEETRVAALDWLIMLHRKVPKKILAINDGTFPALLKTLSDPSEQVITRDLRLLAQISYNSDDEYFSVFMFNLLNLFSTDRRLLETRGNLIIRQLCLSLKPERIYSTLAEILENEEEDLEFASLMVQYLNNILLTAPELSQLRMRLRNLKNKEGVTFFTALFRSWCHNPSAALTLCLQAQAYEYAFVLLQTIVEFEITIPLLVQIDKLVQLLESPVFTHLRLQLLEPEKYPFLYKCLYGILMLLPQSSAFATLRNRLNSVSSIGYLHVPSPNYIQQMRSGTGSRENTSGGSKVLNRVGGSLSSTTGGSIGSSALYDVRWPDLVKKFQAVQQKHQDARYKASIPSMPGVSPPIGVNGINGLNGPSGPTIATSAGHYPNGSSRQFSTSLGSPASGIEDYFSVPQRSGHGSPNLATDTSRQMKGGNSSNWNGSQGSRAESVPNVTSRYLKAGGVMPNVTNTSVPSPGVSRGNSVLGGTGIIGRRPTGPKKRNDHAGSATDTETESLLVSPKPYKPAGNGGIRRGVPGGR